jgi:hypothetical protein
LKRSTLGVKESQYRLEFARECWEAIHAYREGCLCKACFNYRLYREALSVVAKLLALLLIPLPADDEDDAVEPDAGAEEMRAQLGELRDFCQLQLMSQVGNAMVSPCASCLQEANAQCLRGCGKCGFQRLWSKGIRPKLVYPSGKLRPGVSRVWLTKMHWDRVKSGGDGSSSEDDLRQKREGTVIDLLDEFEPIQNTWTPHRYNIVNAKVSVQALALAASCAPTPLSPKRPSTRVRRWLRKSASSTCRQEWSSTTLIGLRTVSS